MWRASFSCTRDSDHHYEGTVELARSPYLVTPDPQFCHYCGEPMRLGKVEDLRTREYNIRKKKTKKAKCAAAQLPLV